MNRFLLIGGIVIAVLALILAVYFLFFRERGPALVADPGTSFGLDGNEAGGLGGDSEVREDQAIEEVAPRLVRISEGPVAYGASVLLVTKSEVLETVTGTTSATSTKTSQVVEVRFVERVSGNVYSYDTDTRTITRISNRTLPGIQEAVWTRDGSVALLRYLSEGESGELRVETYVLPVNEPEEGYFLEPDLDEVVVSGTSTIVTLLPSTSGSIATAAQSDGSAPRTVFSSLLSSLRLLPSGTNFAVFTKPSSSEAGYLFSVSAATGAFERLVGPERALTALPSPSGSAILFSYLSGNALVASLLDMTSREKVAIPVGALPEKCVWARDETILYCAVPRSLGTGWPDRWYQGVVSYSDRIWEIDLERRVASQVLDPLALADVEIDAIALSLDPSGDYLVFTNKKDGSLWAYDL